MAQMAMVGSASNAYDQGKEPMQKTPAASPAGSFGAFLKSAPERAAQKLSLLPGSASSPRNQTNANARSRNPIARHPTARDKDNSEAHTQTQPTPTAVSMQKLAHGASAPAAAPPDSPDGKDSADTKKSCENPKNSVKGTDIQTAVPIDPALSAAPPAGVVATGQAAAQMPDGDAGSPQAGSAFSDDSRDLKSACLPAPLAAQLAGKPAAAVMTSPADDSIFEKAGFEKAAASSLKADEIASSADPASQPAGFTADFGPTKAAEAQTPQPNMLNAQPSADAAMADANRAVALRVSRAIRSGENTLTIELHPAELGHVAVHIAFRANGVDVQMLVGREDTFKAFNQDRAALEQQFGQAGIDLGGGGLDLRYSQTPASEGKQAWTPGSSQPGDGPSETETRAVFSGGNLVDIVA